MLTVYFYYGFILIVGLTLSIFGVILCFLLHFSSCFQRFLLIYRISYSLAVVKFLYNVNEILIRSHLVLHFWTTILSATSEYFSVRSWNVEEY